MPRLWLVLIILVLLAIPVSDSRSQDEQPQPGSEQVSWSFSGPMAEDGTWEMTVTASKKLYAPGDTATIGIEFTIHSLGLAYNIGRTRGVYTLVTGQRAFDGYGNMTTGDHAMISPILNGVGLPIEGETLGFPTDRLAGGFHHPIDSVVLLSPSELVVDASAGTVRGNAVHGIVMDPNMPLGWYQLRVDLGLQVTETSMVTLWGEDPSNRALADNKQTYATTGPISVGASAQPRIIWTLFSNNTQSAPAVALEDQGMVAVNRGAGLKSQTILPMTDSTGAQARYLIEPDFPLVWNPFMRTGGCPLDLDYESGWMEVKIQNPNGSVIDLGGAKFAGRRGMGATTLKDRFVYSFSSYGKHAIELTGWIADKTGQVYEGGGVYEVYIARPLEIESNVLPGTPFRKNQYFDPGFQIYPPVPARVEVQWTLDRLSSGLVVSDQFEAIANLWGYYSPPIVSGRNRITIPTRIQFSETGEYKVSFRATYQDESGNLWMGEKITAGVVHSDNAVPLSSQPEGTGAYTITTDARYVPLPADSGDTVLLPGPSAPNLPTVFTFPMGFFLNDQSGFRTDDSALSQRTGAFAGVFAYPRLATSDGLFPHFYPESVDRRAYLMTSASRSDGTGREYIGDGSDSASLPWPAYPWLPGEMPVDAPGDIYHFWSAMVYRDFPGNSTQYGFYSAGAAISTIVSTPRAHVEGSPLVSDGWGSKNLVMHNLAVRPGTILGQDTPFTPAAYFLPLPASSTMEFTIMPPVGNQQTVSIQCDSSGYASSMGERFPLDKPGVYEVQTRLTQGEQVGSILGVGSDQKWVFYVLDPGNRLPILFNLPMEERVDATAGPLVLSGNLSQALIASGKVYVTTTFNGSVIEQTERDIADSSFEYSIDLTQVSNSFPNFSLTDPNDRIVFSFFADGVASTGQRRMAARVVYLQNGILYAGDPGIRRIEPASPEERNQPVQEETQETGS